MAANLTQNSLPDLKKGRKKLKKKESLQPNNLQEIKIKNQRKKRKVMAKVSKELKAPKTKKVRTTKTRKEMTVRKKTRTTISRLRQVNPQKVKGTALLKPSLRTAVAKRREAMMPM